MSKNRGFAHIEIIVVIILIAIVGVVVFVMSRNSGTPLVSQASPSPEAMVGEDMNDWETYTNNDLGISFKHPNSENVYVTPLSEIEDIDDLKRYEGFITVSDTLVDGTSLSYLERCEGNQFCLIPGKNWGRSSDFEKTTLGGKQAVDFIISEASVDNVIRVIQTVEDPKFEISMAIDGAGLNETFDQILSTFEFTN